MVHHITAATSNVATSGDGFADSGPDTSLIVDANAFLISKSGGDGALLNGAWTATINGEVQSFFAAGAGVRLTGSAPSDVFNVTIGSTGDVFGSFGVRIEEGTGTLTNKGVITAAGFGLNGSGSVGLRTDGSGADVTVNNSGLIQSTGTGLSHLGSGVLTLVNSGTIAGTVRAISASGEAHIKNLGMLDGDVRLGTSDDSFSDFGVVKKHTSHGTVTIIKNGTVVGVIDLGDGADTFTGGANAERVRDAAGGDTYKLGGGNDTFIAINTGSTTGNDTVDGGKGIDTYDARGSVGSLTVNLNTHATAGDVAGDTVIGFENVIGGDGVCTLIGSAASNSLTGGTNEDQLTGLGGRDILTGGADADTFHFLARSDSGTTASTRDVITDFTQGSPGVGDRIDIQFDAKTGGAPDDVFTLIGFDNFTGVKGQLRESFSGGDTIISGDVNGDKHADFSIALKGHFLLTTDDFTNVL